MLKMKKRVISIALSTLLILFVQIAYGISFSCENCYVNDCTCFTDCSSGFLKIFETNCYDATAKYEIDFSSGVINWKPKSSGIYKAEIECDDGSYSSCQTIQVREKTTTTTFITTKFVTYPTRPKTPTPRKTTTTTIKTTTTKTTTSTTTTSTTTKTTTTRVTTTTEETPWRETTTTFYVCNNNYICEAEIGENYGNCPRDCPSGLKDNYCDGVEDDRCDPDCLSFEDIDCKVVRCGDKYCDLEIGETPETCPDDCTTAFCGDNYCDVNKSENYLSCPNDCPSGSSDGYCDKVKDSKCDPDCKEAEDEDCKRGILEDIANLALPLILIFVLLVLAGFIIFFFYKKGKKRAYEDKNAKILVWLKQKLRDGEDPEILRKGLEAEGYDPSLVEKAEEKLWEN